MYIECFSLPHKAFGHFNPRLLEKSQVTAFKSILDRIQGGCQKELKVVCPVERLPWSISGTFRLILKYRFIWFEKYSHRKRKEKNPSSSLPYLISGTRSSADVLLLTKLAVIAIANLPRISSRWNPEKTRHFWSNKQNTTRRKVDTYQVLCSSSRQLQLKRRIQSRTGCGPRGGERLGNRRLKMDQIRVKRGSFFWVTVILNFSPKSTTKYYSVPLLLQALFVHFILQFSSFRFQE